MRGTHILPLTAGRIQEYYVATAVGASVDVPLGQATLVAAGPTRVFWVSAADGAVAVLDTAGVRRASSFSLRFHRLSVSDANWARAIRARIDAEPLD